MCIGSRCLVALVSVSRNGGGTEGGVGTLADMTQLIQLTEVEIRELPIDRLALLVLKHRAGGEWNSHNLLNNLQRAGFGQTALFCVSEALNWLITHGLVARDKPGQTTSAQSMFVTRAGKRVLVEGIDGAVAAARLSVALHERLDRVCTQFLMGGYELAAFAAMREVEIRVRELAKAEKSLIGVKLMRESFKPNPPRTRILILVSKSERWSCSLELSGPSRTRRVIGKSITKTRLKQVRWSCWRTF